MHYKIIVVSYFQNHIFTLHLKTLFSLSLLQSSQHYNFVLLFTVLNLRPIQGYIYISLSVINKQNVTLLNKINLPSPYSLQLPIAPQLKTKFIPKLLLHAGIWPVLDLNRSGNGFKNLCVNMWR